MKKHQARKCLLNKHVSDKGMERNKKFCTSVIQRKESMNNLIVEYTKKIAKWLVTTCKDV